MTSTEGLSDFVARQRAERAAAGLPSTITDVDTLRVVAALIGREARP